MPGVLDNAWLPITTRPLLTLPGSHHTNFTIKTMMGGRDLLAECIMAYLLMMIYLQPFAAPLPLLVPFSLFPSPF